MNTPEVLLHRTDAWESLSPSQLTLNSVFLEFLRTLVSVPLGIVKSKAFSRQISGSHFMLFDTFRSLTVGVFRHWTLMNERLPQFPLSVELSQTGLQKILATSCPRSGQSQLPPKIDVIIGVFHHYLMIIASCCKK